MILLPETTGFTRASRMGAGGSTRNIPVFGPVSVAVKVSVSPVRADWRVMVRLSTTVGSRLQAAAFTWINSGELMGVARMVLAKVASK